MQTDKHLCHSQNFRPRLKRHGKKNKNYTLITLQSVYSTAQGLTPIHSVFIIFASPCHKEIEKCWKRSYWINDSQDTKICNVTTKWRVLSVCLYLCLGKEGSTEGPPALCVTWHPWQSRSFECRGSEPEFSWPDCSSAAAGPFGLHWPTQHHSTGPPETLTTGMIPHLSHTGLHSWDLSWYLRIEGWSGSPDLV